MTAAQQDRWQRIAFLAGAVVAGIGALSLLGWAVGSDELKSLRFLSGSNAQLKANSAVALVLAGLSLALQASGRGAALARWLAGGTGLIGAATLFEHIFGVSLGIDRLLFDDTTTGVGAPVPGRMGANTAVALTLAGAALLWPRARWRHVLFAQAAALGVAVIAFVALLGYLYDVPRLSRAFVTTSVTPMAMHTAVALLVLAVGIVARKPDTGIVRLLRSAEPGGVLLRRLLPLTVVLPVVLGYVRLKGQQAGLYGTEEGLALLVTTFVVIFTGGLVATAREFERADAGRRRSEERQRAVFAAALDSLITIDEHGLIHDFNPTAERTFGYAREHAIGREMAELIIPPPLREAHRRGLWRFRNTGEAAVLGRRLELTALRADGSEFPIELVIRRAANEPLFVGHIRDVSDREAREQEIRRLATIVEASRDPIVGIDLTGSITVWNPAATRLFGYAEDEIVGRPISVLAPDADHEAQSRMLEELQAGRSLDAELVRVRKDGSQVTVLLSASPILDAGGTVVGATGAYRDVSERRRLEEQMRQAQKMEAVGQLAGGIAHDFRNLMSVIMGFSSLLRRDVDGDDSALHRIDEIDAAAQRASKLTGQLLAFSRRQMLSPTPLDLGAVVEELFPMLSRLIGEDIHIERSSTPDLPLVLADRQQIEQVVMNLAVNARDAMPTGGTLTIAARAADGEHVLLAVSDTGTGIEAEVLEHIFEPFFTTKEIDKGTGLGLATVDGIVAQSGGRITVSSEPGKGTTFEVFLPIAQSSEPAVPDFFLEEEVPLDGTETVLVCEDDPGLRVLIEQVLGHRGYTALITGDPVTALQVARDHPGHIDALMSDVIMPHMPGPDLARRVQEIRPGIRTLFVSGYSPETVHDRGNLPAGSVFLEKPFLPDTLLRRLREVLRQSPV